MELIATASSVIARYNSKIVYQKFFFPLRDNVEYLEAHFKAMQEGINILHELSKDTNYVN
jgi:hypothetical protein